MYKSIVKKIRRADKFKTYVGLLVKQISKYFPKKNNVVLVMPRFSQVFSGNLKYIYLYLVENYDQEFKTYIVLKKGSLSADLRALGYPVLEYPKVSSLFTLLRAKTVIVESTRWGKMLKSAATFGAVRYQVWHGNGMKNVAMANAVVTDRISDPIKEAMYDALDIYPIYDYMVFSSELQFKTRAHSFKFKDHIINGQPRDDVILGRKFNGMNVGANESVINKILASRKKGMRIVLFSPTWRIKTDFQPIHAMNAIKLDQFCMENNILLIYKPHPKEYARLPESNNIVRYEKEEDIYPAFKYFDVMVTDYSSIFMDFLLLNKPVVFFLYDKEKYESDRGLQHKIEEVCPGPICKTQDELHESLLDVLNGKDNFEAERKSVVNEFNDYNDCDNCERLVKHIRDKAFL